MTAAQLVQCELTRLGRRSAETGEPSETITVRVWAGSDWENHQVTVAVARPMRNGVDLSRFRPRSETSLPIAAALWRGR